MKKLVVRRRGLVALTAAVAVAGSVAALPGLDRHPGEPQPLDVPGRGPRRHPQLPGQLGDPHPPSPGRVQPFDEMLVALHAAQRQVSGFHLQQ